MTYSFPYLVVFVIFSLMALVYAQRCDSEKDKKLCEGILIASVGLFYVFFAFRGYVYTDWVGYAESYANVTWSDVFEITKPKQGAVIHEPGFTLLMCLCRLFSDEYAFLVIVITSIDLYLFLRVLRKWEIKNLALFFMLFITFHGVGLMFNALRNQISIFIFMNLLEYIDKKQPLKYYVGCLIALCFHSTSLLFLPLYFVLRYKFNKWLISAFFIALLAFYFSHISFIQTMFSLLNIEGALGEKAMVYTEIFTSSTEFSLTGTVEKVMLVGLIVCYYESLTKNRMNVIFINCLLIYLFFYYVFSEFETLSSRLCMIFQFSYWVLWMELIKSFNIQNNKRLFCAFLFLFCFYVTLMGYPTPIQEYDNLLWGAKTQEQRLQIYNSTHESAV